MLPTVRKIKRFHVIDRDIGKWLENFNFIVAVGDVTTYYDTHFQSFFKNNILISSNGFLLEIKSNPNHPDLCSVLFETDDHLSQWTYQFDLPFEEDQKPLFITCAQISGVRQPRPFTWRTFLQANDLQKVVTFDVTRRTYIHETLTITIDEVPPYGTFIRFKDNDHTRSFDEFDTEVDILVASLRVKPMVTNYINYIFCPLSPTLSTE
jgi:hypothetical protein